jgi:CRISPR type IV-associated protein Csf3
LIENLIIWAVVKEPFVSAPALDGLLGATLAEEQGLVAGFGEMVDIDLPLERSPCGRVWLASFAQFVPEIHEVRHTHRRFPIEQAQMLGAAGMRKIDIGAGVNRSYRIPGRVSHAQDDTITWYARGEWPRVEELLSRVTHLGKRRAVGRGAITSWQVASAGEGWPGFPVMLNGKPLRALPVDWPGLAPNTRRAYQVLRPPYWEQRRAELAAVP